ncbi:Hypothetical protein LOCK908_1197 [Lacticaseibacillus rhamnosus LOCK908]|nr:hypothetical protein LRHK_1138 [Lacticaseibacillus rhamnosus ATCC 8530]AGP70925.1 Hypothetical protein LOCK900_1113 [Lacticaseibacillus rhamnosus LOCK900]AGP73837.1 Hypothetical protein LOCK908_1197 [Lacticaseibacillus rhamnosus LOCK908]
MIDFYMANAASRNLAMLRAPTRVMKIFEFSMEEDGFDE